MRCNCKTCKRIRDKINAYFVVGFSIIPETAKRQKKELAMLQGLLE